jgi:hypothetical protein
MQEKKPPERSESGEEIAKTDSSFTPDEAANRFRSLARRLIQVPKSELENAKRSGDTESNP